MKYDDEVRARSESQERYFESLECFQEKVSAYRTDKDGRGDEKIVHKRPLCRKTRLPQDEELGYLLQHFVQHDAHGACDAEKWRGGERGDDNDAVADIVNAVAQKDTIGINARVRMVAYAGIVVVVKMRQVPERDENDKRARNYPRETQCDRPRVSDYLRRKLVYDDKKHSRGGTDKKVQIAFDEWPRLTPCNELARKRYEHDEERCNEYFKHAGIQQRQYNTGMLDKKLRSFRYAFEGFRIAWREEFNFRFNVVCAVLAVLLGWYFGISSVEWIIVIFLIGFVLMAESFNTALEELCDMYRPVHDPHVAKIKDLSAGAVLLAAIASLIIGCIIFLPRIAALFS